MNGILLVDKPQGPTSFDVVRIARRATFVRSVGHTGTLDPMASGLLVVCVGEATKLVPYLMDSGKRYLATVSLGTATDTDDAMGQVIAERPVPSLEQSQLEEIGRRYQGAICQVPPVYAAIKQGGEALYRKARRGEKVEVPPRTVEIHSLSVRWLSDRELRLDVRCGKGTYIRALARDLAQELGTVGHLSMLRRLETGGYNVEQACGLDVLERAARREADLPIATIESAVASWTSVALSPEAEDHIRHGRPCTLEQDQSLEPGQKLALLRGDRRLLAIGRAVDHHTVTSERLIHCE